MFEGGCFRRPCPAMDWLTVVLLALPTTILLINTSHKFNYVAKFVYLYASYIVSSFHNLIFKLMVSI